ncbi:hypothetical protein AAY473_035669, partial [Plecturocebus cupreus]
MGFLHVGQAGLKLLTSGDLHASASQSAGIIGIDSGVTTRAEESRLHPCIRHEFSMAPPTSPSAHVWLQSAVGMPSEALGGFFHLHKSIDINTCGASWSAMVQSQLTATSASQIQGILLPQPPRNPERELLPPFLFNRLQCKGAEWDPVARDRKSPSKESQKLAGCITSHGNGKCGWDLERAWITSVPQPFAMGDM